MAIVYLVKNLAKNVMKVFQNVHFALHLVNCCMEVIVSAHVLLEQYQIMKKVSVNLALAMVVICVCSKTKILVFLATIRLFCTKENALLHALQEWLKTSILTPVVSGNFQIWV